MAKQPNYLAELDDYILEQTGADNWEMVISSFKALTKKEIKGILDSYLTQDNNSLANDIYKRMKDV